MASGSGKIGSDVELDDDHHDSSGSGSGGDDAHAAFDDPLFYFENTPKIGGVETPGKVRPDKRFEMKVVGRSKEMPDGRDVEFWTFENVLEDSDDEVVVPGSLIRVNEGDIVHVTVKPAKRQHTIHHHGIEADTFNDGVGHTSFEVSGEYTYQFRAGAPFRSLTDPRPQTRGAGTYVYHCHVNTTLHYQMGMWGPLIVDPATGPGTAFHGGPSYDVDAERIWAAGDVDPRWHGLNHQVGLKGGDARLNVFKPKYFHISGEFQPMRNGRTDPNAVIDHPAIATEVELGGEPLLVRWINAAYTIQRITFAGIADGSLRGQVIATDGRPFDDVPPNFAKPVPLIGPIEAISAERYDLLVTPERRGTSVVTIENLDWITRRRLGVARTLITVV